MSRPAQPALFAQTMRLCVFTLTLGSPLTAGAIGEDPNRATSEQLDAAARGPAPRAVVWGAPAQPLHPRLGLDGQLVAGAIVPSGELSRHARAGFVYGAALGGEWRLEARHAARASIAYARSQVTAKQPGLHGAVKLDFLTLRGEYVFGDRWWRPYIGAGLGLTPWRGAISQPEADRSNAAHGHPFVGLVAGGLELAVWSHLSAVLDLSWTQLGGDFKASFWSAGLALRWRL